MIDVAHDWPVYILLLVFFGAVIFIITKGHMNDGNNKDKKDDPEKSKR